VAPIELVGWSATAVSTLQFVPQVARTVRSADVAGVSPGMWALMLAQAGAWLGFGLREELYPAVITNVVLATCASLMLRLLVVHRAPRVRHALALVSIALAVELVVFVALPNAVLGLVGAALAFLLLWPQVIVVVRGDVLTGLSRTSWLLSIANTLLWVGYGVGRQEPLLWLSAGQALVLSVVILVRIVGSPPPGAPALAQD
jgi:uncharacterized protein with PQ loop repeat